MYGEHETKNAVRQRVWSLLDHEKVTSNGAAGRIPDFIGSEAASNRLAAHRSWQSASIVKAVPDRAQMPVRAKALEEGKCVYMAASKLAAQKPFYFLDPKTLPIPLHEAADRRKAADFALLVDLEEMAPVDLIVCGSVAVNYEGVRLGKGAGYSDIEVALLQESNLMGPNTIIATTVHELQIVDEELPEADHDFRVDVIATPDRIIECAPFPRPPGVIWERLSSETIAAIPVLAKFKL